MLAALLFATSVACLLSVFVIARLCLDQHARRRQGQGFKWCSYKLNANPALVPPPPRAPDPGTLDHKEHPSLVPDMLMISQRRAVSVSSTSTSGPLATIGSAESGPRTSTEDPQGVVMRVLEIPSIRRGRKEGGHV